MDLVLEMLAALAAVFTILRFVLDEWREYQHEKRTTREIGKDRD